MISVRHLLKLVLLVPQLTVLGQPLTSLGQQVAQAQERAPIQLITGYIEPREITYYRLPDLRQGDKIYVYANATSGNLDPLVGLMDASIDANALVAAYIAEVELVIEQGRDPLEAIGTLRKDYLLAWDDDSGDGYAAALSFTVPASGAYRLLLAGSLGTLIEGSFGDYRLLIGLNSPQVLTGQAEPTGDTIAILDSESAGFYSAAQEINGSLSPDKPSETFHLIDIKPGDTLYTFVEAISGNLKPVLALEDYGQKPVRSSNMTGQENWAALEYTFDERGRNYRLNLSSCCQGQAIGEGEYRLWVGINEPQVLTGKATSTGDVLVRSPISVETGLKLQQIIDVDQQLENFTVVATLLMEWLDPALAFSPDSCQCWFKYYTDENFLDFTTLAAGRWPDFTLYNQQGRRFTQNRSVVITSDGRATYFERFTATLQLDFDFRQYPFDEQRFIINIDMLYPEEYYVFSKIDGFSEISQDHGEDEFILTDFDITTGGQQANTRSTTSRFTFLFDASRHLNYYFLRIFLPVALIMAVSWVTFFLKDYTRRIEVATGNLLLFIALSFSFADNYPRLGYLTFLDAVMAVTFLINALVVMYNVYLRRLEMQGKEEFAEHIDNYLDWIYPLSYIASILIIGLIFFS